MNRWRNVAIIALLVLLLGSMAIPVLGDVIRVEPSGSGGMVVHGNEYHNPDFATEASVTAINNTVNGIAGNVTYLQGNLTDLQDSVTSLNGTVVSLNSTVAGHTIDIGNLQSDVSNLQGNVSAIQGDVSDIQGDISDIQGDISDLQGNVTDLDSAVSDLQGDVSDLQGDLSDLQGDFSSLNSTVSALNITVSGLAGDVSDLQGDVSDLQGAVSDLQGDVSDLQGAVSDLQGDVSALENRMTWAEGNITALQGKSHTQGTDTTLGTLIAKNPPIDADLAIYRDSTNSSNLVTSTWTQIKAFLKTYFDTLYAAATHSSTHEPGGADQVHSIGDNDDDTKIQTEESADEDAIRMDTKGVETFVLSSDGIVTLPKQSFVIVYANTSQNILKDTLTQIQLNVEIYDVQGEFDTGTYRFTAKEAGVYSVVSTIRWSALTASGRILNDLFKNGALYQSSETYATIGSYQNTDCQTIMYLAANDYIESYAYQSTGATQATYVAQTLTKLCIMKLG